MPLTALCPLSSDDGRVYLPRRSEIAEALRAEHQATAAQVSEIVAYVYFFRGVLLLTPLVVLVGNVEALAPVRPVFFSAVIGVTVVSVFWQIVTGWIGTIQSIRGRGDFVAFGTFVSLFVGLSWTMPRRGSSPTRGG